MEDLTQEQINSIVIFYKQLSLFRKELIELYMQGYYDRDWKISEDEADKKAEVYADKIMKKYKLKN